MSTKYMYNVSIFSFLFGIQCSIVRKMAQYMADILEPEDKDRLHDNLLVGSSKVHTYYNLHIFSCLKYLGQIRFQWRLS